MNYQFELHPEAVYDIEEAFEWYESKRVGLGKALVIELDSVLEKVKRSPYHYQELDFGLRGVLLKRFPYKVIFQLSNTRIIVLAIFHQKRDPRRLTNRF